MTQDERCFARYNEGKAFIEENHCNLSSHDQEERFRYYNWLKHNKKLLNCGEMKQERVGMFLELLALMVDKKK